MSEKKFVSICPTGHEGWFKHLAHFFGSDISNPVTHRFTDPISNERVESTTAFPEKSAIGCAVVKVLGQVDRQGNSYAKILFDSPYLYGSDLDVAPVFSSGNLVAYSVRDAKPVKILVDERPTNKMYTELFHPIGRV